MAPCHAHENSDGQLLAIPNFICTMMPQFTILDDMVCLLYNSFFFCYDHVIIHVIKGMEGLLIN
jgi:hypothetical protein